MSAALLAAFLVTEARAAAPLMPLRIFRLRMVGVAIASTVAATRLGTLLRGGQPASVALTGAFHWALWACAAIALLALPATATLLRRATAPTAAPQETTTQPTQITT